MPRRTDASKKLSHAAYRTLHELREHATPSGYCPVWELPTTMSDRHRRRALHELAAKGFGERRHGGFVLATHPATKRPYVAVSPPGEEGENQKEDDEPRPHPLVAYFYRQAGKYVLEHRRDIRADNEYAAALVRVHDEAWVRVYIDWWIAHRLYGPIWGFRATARGLEQYIRGARSLRRTELRAYGQPHRLEATQTLLAGGDIDEVVLGDDQAHRKLTSALRDWARDQEPGGFPGYFCSAAVVIGPRAHHYRTPGAHTTCDEYWVAWPGTRPDHPDYDPVAAVRQFLHTYGIALTRFMQTRTTVTGKDCPLVHWAVYTLPRKRS